MVSDPRCPACDGPVGTTSSYCMHCGAEFDSPVGVGDDRTTTDTDPGDGVIGGADVFDDESTDTANDQASTGGQTTGTRRANADLTGWEAKLDAWLAPDGWLDNSLTVVIAIVAGFFIGPLVTMVVGLATGSAWALAAGFVGWLGSTVYLARKRTVYGAVHDGCLAVAGLLLVLPLTFLVSSDGTIADRLVDVVIGEFVLVFFAGPLLVVGRLVGRIGEKK